jgi:oligosaccharide repeat unit polymerase
MQPNQHLRMAAQLLVAVTTAAALCWLLGQPERYLQIAAGILLLVLIGSAVLVHRLSSGDRLLNIKDVILSSYALFLGVGMISDVFRGNWHFNETAILLAYGALLSLLIGFVVETRLARPGGGFIRQSGFSDDQLFKVALLFFALGFGFLALEWSLYGHLQSYLVATESASRAAVEPKPYIHAFTQLTGPALLLGLILLRRGVSHPRACLLTFLSALIVVWYIFSGVRTNLAWLAIGFLLVWSEIPDRYGRRRMRGRATLLITAAAVAILAVTFLRTSWNLARIRNENPSGVWRQLDSGLDTFYQLRRTVEYFPSRSRFLIGYSLYGIAVNPIPRALWPQKPIGFGRLASILYDRNPNSTLGLSLPGELYANFGIPGCLVGMFLFGLLAVFVNEWYSRRRGDAIALVIYILLIQYAWFAVRGDMLDAASPVLYQLLPFVTCLLLLPVRSRRLTDQRFQDSQHLAFAPGYGLDRSSHPQAARCERAASRNSESCQPAG